VHFLQAEDRETIALFDEVRRHITHVNDGTVAQIDVEWLVPDAPQKRFDPKFDVLRRGLAKIVEMENQLGVVANVINRSHVLHGHSDIREIDIRAELPMRRGFGNLHLVGSSLGIPLRNREGSVRILCGFLRHARGLASSERGPSSEEEADDQSGKFQASNQDVRARKPVAFLYRRDGRPLGAQISIIPILWLIAIGLIGFGSYAGVFGRKRQSVTGWLVFVIGVGLVIYVLELLISGVT
jgi:hypothetical protein